MIDISQIVGNAAAALGNLKSPDAGKGGDANPFQDALSRARQDGQQSAPAAAQVKVPAKDGKQADASKDSAAQKPQQPAANNALPQKDTSKVAAKGDTKPDDAKDGETDDTASSDAAAAAAALAAAALLTQPPAPQAPAAGSTAGYDTSAINGLPTLPSAQGTAQGASAAATAAAAAAAAATTTADPAADAAALQAQAEARLPTVAVDTAAKGTTASPTDTLALIAQQRAALQNNAPTTADKIAATVTAPAQAAAQDARGQGAGQQHANLGHQNQPALTPADNAQASQPTQAPVTPFAAAQASVRTGEGVDTGATNASSAATIASALAAQTPAQAAQANAAAAAARPVIAPNVGDSQWSQALGQQMVRLSTQGNQTAELDLNPPNLGPLKVVLNVVNDQAQAQFVSPHQAVRAAVEAALPHLRTSMAEAGIQLGQTSVGADSFAQANSGGQQQQQQRQAGNGSSFGQAMGFGKDTAAPAAPATPRAARTLARGEVDTFA
ncbi:flagellar hook-length control protein FliK [Cupriavidus pauculus]|uniref:Flagellar hook-length control protein FliK n=1 Tax=Cupriavidus pauculus TaxID=82633 RepID=A0A2N5CER8_9BURK|nr:flagellar hook-length control protein FliK [Cupriavidus pauculus]PLQ00730.1 flagellar hook-length control protein FliK [Cupriavidus pauculus]